MKWENLFACNRNILLMAKCICTSKKERKKGGSKNADARAVCRGNSHRVGIVESFFCQNLRATAENRHPRNRNTKPPMLLLLLLRVRTLEASQR